MFLRQYSLIRPRTPCLGDLALEILPGPLAQAHGPRRVDGEVTAKSLEKLVCLFSVFFPVDSHEEKADNSFGKSMIVVKLGSDNQYCPKRINAFRLF